MGKRGEERKKLRSYGQLVCNFANAKTTDYACLNLFQDIQNIHELSSTFSKEIQGVFPSLTKKDLSLDDSEMQLIHIIQLQKKLKADIRRDLEKVGYDFDIYDPKERSVMIDPVYREGQDPIRGEPGVLTYPLDAEKLNLEEFKDRFRDEFVTLLPKNIFERMDLLMEVANTVEETISRIDAMRTQEIFALPEDDRGVLYLHAAVHKHQEDLREALNGIIGGEPLYRISLLATFLDAYNELPRAQMVSSRDCFRDDLLISEEAYLSIEAPEVWSTRIRDDLAFFLVEFLRHEENRRLIRRCAQCGGFSISEMEYNPKSGLKFCNGTCRKAYHYKKKGELGLR
jgi:hypothetical protein